MSERNHIGQGVLADEGEGWDPAESIAVHTKLPDDCTNCDGTGLLLGYKCTTCGGKGFRINWSQSVHLREPRRNEELCFE